jgi:hypothetical protein
LNAKTNTACSNALLYSKSKTHQKQLGLNNTLLPISCTMAKRRRDDDDEFEVDGDPFAVSMPQKPATKPVGPKPTAAHPPKKPTAAPAPPKRPVLVESSAAAAPAAPAAPAWPAAPAAPPVAAAARLPVYIDDPAREDSVTGVESWLKACAIGKPLKPLLLVGPSGAGKTCLVRSAAARLLKLPLETFDDQDLADYLAPAGLRPRGPAFIDGIEALDATERLAVKAAIQKAPKGLARALILTADDLFEDPAKAWKSLCAVVRIDRPSRAFIVRLLKAKSSGMLEAHVAAAADAANGSTALAMNAARFLARTEAVKAGALSGADLLYDVPKAVGETLRGRRVPCLGGSSDTSFYGQMVALQLPQTNCSIGALAKAIDRWSFYDASSIARELDTDSHWTLVSLMASQGPKLAAGARWNLEWPKSVKPSGDKYGYGREHGYVSKPQSEIEEY